MTTIAPPHVPTRGARAWLVLAIVSFVATRGCILASVRPQETDVPIYLEYAVRAIDLGDEPYGPEFPIEYPPVAWWTMAAMRVGSGPALAPGSGRARGG